MSNAPDFTDGEERFDLPEARRQIEEILWRGRKTGITLPPELAEILQRTGEGAS
ncbi:hypothetical protein AB0395_22065 [Streptosporangium sp. NPDC051023]|uniref:hypothetical protein n=1 Tax=Streptosporangium sp. NPDC051023 TaxID=3155410 RepID=UPI00344E8E83